MRLNRIVLVSVVLGAAISAARVESASSPLGALPEAPLSLEQCVALALENHPTLRGARDDLEAARAGVKVSKAAALPQLGVSSGYTQSGGALSTGGRSLSQDGFAAGLDLKQLLFDSGRTPALIQEAESTLYATAATYAQTEQAVVFGARQSYFRVLAAEQLAAARTQARDLAELHLKAARARHDQGIAPKADMTKADVEVANAELDLIRAHNEVRLAYAALNNALGLPPTASLSLAGDLQTSPEPPSLEACLEAAYRYRPELQRAEAQIESARARVTVAGSATRPALFLTASNDWLDTSSASSSTWTVGLTVGFSLWDGGATHARIAQARAAMESAQASFDTAKQQVGLEVQQAYLSLVEADQRVLTAARLVEQAEENHRIAQGRYESGVGPMIDVVDAETALTAARTSRVQALYDSQVARARLDLALGRAFRPGGAGDEK